jgi:hypothetical protein
VYGSVCTSTPLRLVPRIEKRFGVRAYVKGWVSCMVWYVVYGLDDGCFAPNAEIHPATARCR